jgi:ubiquinone biosynthesis protein
MHPGNIFVCGKNIENPKFITVDFGIMGTLSLADQNYLAENFLALFNRNYQRIAELHQKSGWLSEKSCLSSFETSLRTICEPIFERPLSEISFGGLLLQLFQIAHQHKINIQPQLILLQKTLMNVEGLARHLYPKLDLWTTAKPFLETWTKKQMQFSTLIQKMKSQAPYWLDKLPEIPSLLYNFIEQQTYAKDALFQPPAKIVIEVKTSKKDIFVGILLGLALSLVIVVAKLRGYF